MGETVEYSPKAAGDATPMDAELADQDERVLLLECRLEQLGSALDDARADADRARAKLADAAAREAEHARRYGVIQQELAEARAEIASLHERLGRSEALRAELEGHLFEAGARGDAAELVCLRREMLAQRQRFLISERTSARLRARVDELLLSRETLLTRVAEWQRLIRKEGPEAVDLAEFIAELRRDVLHLEQRNAARERQEAALRDRLLRAGVDPDAPIDRGLRDGPVDSGDDVALQSEAETQTAEPSGAGDAGALDTTGEAPPAAMSVSDGDDLDLFGPDYADEVDELEATDLPDEGSSTTDDEAHAPRSVLPASLMEGDEEQSVADVAEEPFEIPAEHTGPVGAGTDETDSAEGGAEAVAPAEPTVVEETDSVRADAAEASGAGEWADEEETVHARADRADEEWFVAAEPDSAEHETEEAEAEEAAAVVSEAALPDVPQVEGLDATDPAARAAAYEQVARLLENDPSKLARHLRSGLADPHPRVRRRAVLAAATARNLSVRTLLGHLRDDPDAQVRRVVREVLRHAPGGEPNTDSRGEAVLASGRPQAETGF